jgi:hypothetical protein
MGIEPQYNRPVGGIAPFGYRWKSGHLQVEEKEAQIRKLIYELFIKHRRKRVVANLLNDLGYRTRSGSLFSDTTIDRLIRDTTAKGIRIESGQTVKVEPIVTIELWEKANNFLTHKQTRTPVHLFVGLVKCECGTRMGINNQHHYICQKCKRKIPSNDLEHVFVSQISKLEVFADDNHNLCWDSIGAKDQRTLIENVLTEIVVGRSDIHLEFALRAHSPKTLQRLQQNPPINKSPDPTPESTNQPILNEPLINETEAAKFLGISKMTLLRRRNAGEVSFYRVGFRILYSREKHLIPFLNKCEK